MTRFLLRSRRLFAVGIFFLLAVVVSLSAATRRPCLHTCSGPWRVWKAGHMSKPEGQEIGKLRATFEAGAPRMAAPHAPLPPPSVYIPLAASISPSVTIVARIRNFRAPPARG